MDKTTKKGLCRMVNRVLLALSASIMTLASIIALYAIFYSVPACPAGAISCPATDAHHAGGRLAAIALLMCWVFVLGWMIVTRRQEARGSCGILPAFWIGPVIVLCFFYFQ